MKQFLILLILLTSCKENIDKSEESIYPDFQYPESKEISKDWKVLVSVWGELNNDSKQDLVVIYESKHNLKQIRYSYDTVFLPARSIVVYVSKNGSLKKIVQNNDFIARYNEGDLSLDSLHPKLILENKHLTISYRYTRAETSYTFGYEQDSLRIQYVKTCGFNMIANKYLCSDYDFTSFRAIVREGTYEKVRIKADTIIIQPRYQKPINDFKELYETRLAKEITL